MGCGSSNSAELRRVVPLLPQTTFSYIDKLPPHLLRKIKQQFYTHIQPQTKTLNILGFFKLYSKCKLKHEVIKHLAIFFYDNQNNQISFKQFISKYAILIKCESIIFYRILYEIYKSNPQIDFMNQEEFHNFKRLEEQYFSNLPNRYMSTISLEDFVRLLAEGGFKVSQYQEKLSLTTKEDLPYEIINKEMLDCDFKNYQAGSQYYLISNSWYYRWSFYQDSDQYHFKSTKFVQEASDKKMMKSREVNGQGRRIRGSAPTEEKVIEQPKLIQFQDIEGQYRGQLIDNPSISSQVKVITPNIWKMFCTLLPAEQTFARKAITPDRIDFYPRSIYYLQADSQGLILRQTQHIKYLPQFTKILQLKNNRTSNLIGIFTKNFGQKNWRQVQERKTVGEISLDPRFFIILAHNRQHFINRQFRQQKKRENLQVGDQVFTYFPFMKIWSQAYILGINIRDQNLFKIHFKKYSFRYEIEVERDELWGSQSQVSLMSSKKKYQRVIKGIANVGNTCYLNSIVQSLVATPVLDNFLLNFSLNERNHAITYGLSQMAKSLLNNIKPNPEQFKQIINRHMPLFSGYHQHDAQEFLSLLLDKISEQLQEKPTIIDYLFRGKIQSKLTCRRCKNIRHIQQKMHILSLPIPQAEYNYFSIIIIPVTTRVMKKIVFKLHKNAVIAEYCNVFEERTGESRRNFIFVQTDYNSIKKIRQQMENPSDQRKKIIDIGISPNISLLAFQKLPSKYYTDILTNKSDNSFRDFQPNPQVSWTICKIIGQTSDKILIEYFLSNNEMERVKISKDKNIIAKLGSKSQSVYRKIVLRKYNVGLKRLEQFGLEFLVSIPMWGNYEDIVKIVQRYTENLRQRLERSRTSKKEYLIRLLTPERLKCIFCGKEVAVFNIEQKQVVPCCDIFDKEVPLIWAARNNKYTIFIDWIDFSKCNSLFCSYLQLDPLSKSLQSSRQEQMVDLQACIKLHSQPQQVQMRCQKCGEGYQHLQPLIRSMPNILIIHMKQFRYTPEGHLIKLDLRLRWQEFLDSSKYSLTSNGRLYELFALVKHSGSSESGHYTCVAKRKHPFENKQIWINFDDEVAEILKEGEHLMGDAYLLLYKKVDMPTSSLVIF